MKSAAQSTGTRALESSSCRRVTEFTKQEQKILTAKNAKKSRKVRKEVLAAVFLCVLRGFSLRTSRLKALFRFTPETHLEEILLAAGGDVGCDLLSASRKAGNIMRYRAQALEWRVRGNVRVPECPLRHRVTRVGIPEQL